MNKLRSLAILMVLVMLVITGFQVYWLKDNYRREKKTIEGRTNILFTETVRHLQDSLLQDKLSRVLKDTTTRRKFNTAIPRGRFGITELADPPSAAHVLDILGQQIRNDSLRRGAGHRNGLFISVNGKETSRNSDSSGTAKFSLDSLKPSDVREMVVVKATGNHTATKNFDSIRIRTGGSVVRDIGQRAYGDTSKEGMVQINTIYFNNENGDRIIIKMDSLFNEPLPLPLLTERFRQTLKHEKIDIPFIAERHDPGQVFTNEDSLSRIPTIGNVPVFNLTLGNSFPYLVRKISMPILFSVFLVGITLFSFILLYLSLLRQHRLALLKNDLISNITHELKTPIATVGVAIEALKNFNAIQDPQKTKEYLDISQNELQRLGLLVDKVLKLSMFENKKMEIKKELFSLEAVVNEVTASLRLQLEKYNARITVINEGDTNIQGDRLHMLSVVFNLLDNALKYSKGNAAIQVEIKEQGDNVMLKITDNGIGIPAQYQDKVFEKFFRVPAGDTHNAKGHGLGLSYVAQVVRQHQGNLDLVSHEGLGSTFTIVLPKQST